MAHSVAERPRPIQAARASWVHIAGVAVLTALCVWPAVLNGFPIALTDTGVYVRPALSYPSPGWPPFYRLFVTLTSLKSSLFLTVAVQAGLVSALALLVLSRLGRPPAAVWAVLVAAVVLAANQAPWQASYLMPDVFAALSGVSLIMLLLAPPKRPWERAGLCAMLALGSVFATATLLVNIGLLAVCAGLALLTAGAAAARRIALAALVIGLAAGAATVTNFAVHGQARINTGSGAHMFSRLVDDRTAQPFLRRRCPAAGWKVCAHLDALDRAVPGGHEFLWGGLADQLDAWRDPDGEFAAINRAILAQAQGGFLAAGLKDAAFLAARPTPGTVYDMDRAAVDQISASLHGSFDSQVLPFERSLQAQDRLRSVFPGGAYALSTYLSYLVLLAAIALSLRRGDVPAAAVGVAVFALIAGQLLLHGLLVGPAPRHHAKVAWLGWLFAAALMMRLRAVGPRTAHGGDLH